MAEDFTTPVVVNTAEQEEEGLGFMDILFLCLSKWYWIVISVIVCLIVAVFYIKTTPPTYLRTASVLIKEDTKGKSSGAENLSELGIINTSANVNNEIITLKSPSVVSGVVKRLGLNVNYYIDGRFYKKLLYGTTLPFQITFIENDNDYLEGTLSVKDKKFRLNVTSLNGEDLDYEVKGSVNDTIKTSVGKIVVNENIGYMPDVAPVTEVEFEKYSTHSAVMIYANNVSVALQEKDATVIDISYQDVSIQRAEDFVNTLITVYNENWVKEKNQISVSTSKFIAERLEVIEEELGSVDSDISSYKSSNRIANVDQAAGIYFSKSNDTSDQLLDLNNRKAMANYVRQQLTNSLAQNQILPANSGIENASIEKQIADYNRELLQRNNLAVNSNELNPLVVEIDQRLGQMRQGIKASLDNYVQTLTSQIQTLEHKEARSNTQLTASPTQAKYILSVERQQKVKESLYLFLLQKREENEISQAFTAYNTRIVNAADGSFKPVTPNRKKILLIAFAIGLAIPVALIYLFEATNTRVRGRKDLEKMAVPYIGEIPLSYKKKKHYLSFLYTWIEKLKTKKKDKPDVEKREIVVKEGKRNYINEAFRVVRTNLEFMLGHDGDKVVMTSSLNPGSGKTFIGMNLATSYAIKKKKVIIIDLDLRKKSLSTSYVDDATPGVTEYLNGDVADFHSVIKSVRANLDAIPCGSVPPNPAELLYSPRLEEMINILRKEYDYVFLDCPPAEMLADSSIINKHVDLTLFIIRAELLERNMLPKIDTLYKEHRYKNMAIILNGTVATGGKYGSHKYGYYSKYGYGSGYYGSKDYGSYGSDED